MNRVHAVLLALCLAPLVNAAPLKEPRRLVIDARELKVESPQLFSLAAEPTPLALETLEAGAPLALHPVPRSSCERSGAALCFDAVERRIVYRAARDYMPGFGGLTAEGISLRRDSIRFRYSFR